MVSSNVFYIILEAYMFYWNSAVFRASINTSFPNKTLTILSMTFCMTHDQFSLLILELLIPPEYIQVGTSVSWCTQIYALSVVITTSNTGDISLIFYHYHCACYIKHLSGKVTYLSLSKKQRWLFLLCEPNRVDIYVNYPLWNILSAISVCF